MPTPPIPARPDRPHQAHQAPPLPPSAGRQSPPYPATERREQATEVQRPVTKLEDLLAKKLTATSNTKPCVNPNEQRPAKKEQIGILRKNGEEYQLDYPSGDKSQTQRPEGAYIFAIKASAPHTVMLGRIHSSRLHPDGSDMEVHGHTSLTKREDVLFAGELLFNNGALRHWTNASGHYRPKSSSASQSLLPYPSMLLPLEKYKEVIRDDGTIVRDPEIDRANGYLDPADTESDQSTA